MSDDVADDDDGSFVRAMLSRNFGGFFLCV